jgi:methionyl-tRNA synthetase
MIKMPSDLGFCDDDLERRILRGMDGGEMAPIRYPIEHGTYYAYKGHGCRCDACKRANADQARKRRSSKPEYVKRRCDVCLAVFDQRKVGRPALRCPDHRMRMSDEEREIYTLNIHGIDDQVEFWIEDHADEL